MARPRKCKSVCRFPRNLMFEPAENGTGPAVVLTIDEYETLRLIDREGFSQEACGEQMGVARTTVQQIYASARKKLADMLVEGLSLRIEGGDFRLCDGSRKACEGCFKQKYLKQKGECIMRIAVTYENGTIFQHFGHTEFFKVYDVQNGTVISAEVIGTNGSGHGALAEILAALKAEVLICGGIGGGAQAALAAAGIKLYGGVSGEADKAVEAFLAGELAFNPDVQCTHHGEHHHDAEHHCGSHGCGGVHHCH